MLLNVLEPELLRPRFNKLYEFYLQKYITKSLVKRNGTGVCVCVCGRGEPVFKTGDIRGTFKVRYTSLEEKIK